MAGGEEVRETDRDADRVRVGLRTAEPVVAQVTVMIWSDASGPMYPASGVKAEKWLKNSLILGIVPRCDPKRSLRTGSAFHVCR